MKQAQRCNQSPSHTSDQPRPLADPARRAFAPLARSSFQRWLSSTPALRAWALGAVGAMALAPAASAGDLCFGATAYPVGASPSDVVLADFNNDGTLDLAVANHDAARDNRVSLLLNNGDGTFAPTEFHDVGSRPYWMATGDFNSDG